MSVLFASICFFFITAVVVIDHLFIFESFHVSSSYSTYNNDVYYNCDPPTPAVIQQVAAPPPPAEDPNAVTWDILLNSSKSRTLNKTNSFHTHNTGTMKLLRYYYISVNFCQAMRVIHTAGISRRPDSTIQSCLTSAYSEPQSPPTTVSLLSQYW